MTTELQEAVCSNESVAVQASGVTPTEKCEPEAGVHAAVAGGAPPVIVGVKVTDTGTPLGEVADGAGHVTARVVAPLALVGPLTSAEGELTDPATLYASTAK